MGVRVTGFGRIGTAIKWLRTHAGMTQAELGRRAQVTKGLISKYELGDAKPSLETLEKLIGGLEIDVRELVETLEEVEQSERARHEAGKETPGPAERQRALREVNQDLQRLAGSFDRLARLGFEEGGS